MQIIYEHQIGQNHAQQVKLLYLYQASGRDNHHYHGTQIVLLIIIHHEQTSGRAKFREILSIN